MSEFAFMGAAEILKGAFEVESEPTKHSQHALCETLKFWSWNALVVSDAI